MFNVGGPEILVIALVALLVLGPEQLPKAMRTFGNAMSEIRKVSSGFQSEMRAAMHAAEAESEGGSRSDASSPQAGESPPPGSGVGPSAMTDSGSSTNGTAGTDGSSTGAADRAAG